MDTDTSTAAVALTVKPSVDPKIALAVAAVALTAAGAYGIYRWRTSKKAEATDETPESE